MFALFPYIIANARPDDGSLIDLNPVLLAAIFGCTAEQVSKAIEFLCGPDEQSRTPAHDGCRLLKRGPMTYFVVNLEQYRFWEDKKKTYWREKKREQRHLRKVSKSVQENVQHADADADAKSVPLGTSKAHVQPQGGTGESVCALKKEFQDNGRFEWLEKELCTFYKRPIPKAGRGEEEYLVSEVSRRPDVKAEWLLISGYRSEVGERYFPQSLKVLCQDWDKTLDKARNHAPAPKPFKEQSIIEKDLHKFCQRIINEP